jgi:hypothetical protein
MQSDMKYIFQKYVLPGPGILAGFEPRAFWFDRHCADSFHIKIVNAFPVLYDTILTDRINPKRSWRRGLIISSTAEIAVSTSVVERLNRARVKGSVARWYIF